MSDLELTCIGGSEAQQKQMQTLNSVYSVSVTATVSTYKDRLIGFECIFTPDSVFKCTVSIVAFGSLHSKSGVCVKRHFPIEQDKFVFRWVDMALLLMLRCWGLSETHMRRGFGFVEPFSGCPDAKYKIRGIFDYIESKTKQWSSLKYISLSDNNIYFLTDEGEKYFEERQTLFFEEKVKSIKQYAYALKIQNLLSKYILLSTDYVGDVSYVGKKRNEKQLSFFNSAGD